MRNVYKSGVSFRCIYPVSISRVCIWCMCPVHISGLYIIQSIYSVYVFDVCIRCIYLVHVSSVYNPVYIYGGFVNIHMYIVLP